MSTPMSLVAQGSYVSDGAMRIIQFPQKIDYFEMKNRSVWGTAASTINHSWWYRGFAAGQAQHYTEGGGSAVTATATAAGGLGYTEIDHSTLVDGALQATGTAITAANPAVVTDATPPPLGSIVRMLNTTAMLQIAGMEFTVTAVTPATNFTLGYMDASTANFVAATNADYRVIQDARYLPRRRWISSITVANPCVIGTTVAHGYAVGARITINNPDFANFGMPQINGLTATVTAVTVNTITLNVNSLAFTPFLYPTSAVAATGITQPHVVPFGEVSTILTQATDNPSLFGLQVDTAVVGANTNIMDWIALAREYTA